MQSHFGFNPRSLHRERRARLYFTEDCGRFNPRSLHRERRVDCRRFECQRRVSIHAPYIGSDSMISAIISSMGVSIHAPYIGSDHDGRLRRIGDVVSIHAPYIGSDLAYALGAVCHIVSIHAPYIGSDAVFTEGLLFREVSIHAPYIGSDRSCTPCRSRSSCFNPRSLHRERLCHNFLSAIAFAFQSTLPT